MHDDTHELAADQVEVDGEIVRRLVWGDPLRSVYIRKWVGVVVFTLIALAVALRFPAAPPLERYLVAPVLLVAVVLAVASLFVVRGARAIRRREGLQYLAAQLVEGGHLTGPQAESVATASDAEHGPGQTWRVTTRLDDGSRVTVSGDDSGTAAVART